MSDIIQVIKKKNRLYRRILMFISLLIGAITFNVFLLPLNIVSGGANGIATITKYIYNLDPAVMIFIISMACVILSIMYLGKEKTAGTIVASFLYPLLVKLTSPLGNIFLFQQNDLFMIIIFAGVLTGIYNGIMYKTGYSNGGFPVVSQILYEYHNIPIAKSSMIINVTIVVVGGLFFGSVNAMYAIILLYINSIVMNKILLGISNNKAFYIITSEDKKVKDFITEGLGHKVTCFDVKGGFMSKRDKVILVVIPSREYYKVTEGIKSIDKKAFFVVTDSYETQGEK